MATAAVGVMLVSCGGEEHVGLRDVAAREDVKVGAAVQAAVLEANPEYAETLSREYDSITPENEMKWASIHPQPGSYAFADPDALVDFAEEHDMEVRGHTLVWSINAPWVEQLAPAQLEAALRDHIRTVVGRYRGRVAEWDVVNEAIGDDGKLRDNAWLRGIGPDYVEKAFRWAHEADPHARLYYNDHGAEEPGPKADSIYELVRALKERGVPIDGIGLEMHLPAKVPTRLDAAMKRLAALELDIAITEMDVRVPLPATRAELKAQAEIYRSVARSCMRQPRCKGITTWGFTDKSSWIPGVYPGYGAALPFDERYRPKPAYYGIRRGLSKQSEP